ncbi:hypothetical protein GIB67_021911 [Kingdonia uniflora]|uniref:Uncharacterized protein n=1 Tax=Kingdonia uniflora TaxID=39325 RepID=A0A7J7L138_9MAGN|nr:hypothetical protein GIB67_021911 [Kingdonia uniflora]
MMKLSGKPEVSEDIIVSSHVLLADMKMIPIETHGVNACRLISCRKGRSNSMERSNVMSALQKMTGGVAWGNLDILVVDMPPGTGDAQLTISQKLQLSDARRGANMFRKVEVPILGVIENMSCFKCPHCGEPSYIFGSGGARRTADEMDMEFLDTSEIGIITSSDEGIPIVLSEPDTSVSKAYNDVAKKVVYRLEELAKSVDNTIQN